jgi:hypothetical protein
MGAIMGRPWRPTTRAAQPLLGAMNRCGAQWFACLPAETQTYITIILGAS